MTVDKTHVVFLLLVILIPAVFINFVAGWNVESRWALSTAIARDGVTHIEGYVDQSRDVTEWDGHLYSAKAPGLSLVCVPVLWSLDRIHPVSTFRADTVKRYICRVLAVGLPLAGIGHAIWSLNTPLAPLVAVFTVFGSPLLPYASVFYGHVTAAFLLMFAWRFVVNGSKRGILLAGLLGGLSVVVEYTAILGVLGIGILCLFRNPGRIGEFILGGIPAILILMIYNYVSFGTVIATGYSSFTDPEFREVMGTGFFGFRVPSARTGISMLFGQYRGLFITAPWLLLWFLAVPSAVIRWRRFLPSVLIPVLNVIVISGFTMWWGGASCCMRHLIIMIPFMAVPVVYAGRSYVVPLIVTGLASMVFQACFLLVEPETPENFASPLFNQALPWIWGSRIRPMVIDSIGVPAGARSAVVFAMIISVCILAITTYRRRRVVSGDRP